MVYRPSSDSIANPPSSAWPSERSSSSTAPTSTTAPITWPPSKPISIRTRSSANADDLREDAVDGVGMDEGNLEAEEPAPRALVDQLGAACRQLVERSADVFDFDRKMVQPRTAAGEELADRRLLAEGGEQLDAAAADAHGRRLDALLGDGLAVLEPGAEESVVRGQRRVEIVDGDAEVMDSARLHAADATECTACGARASYSEAAVGKSSAATTRTVPTVSEALDSAATPTSSAPSSSLSSVSFSSSSLAIRSSEARCFWSRRSASSKASSVRRACSWSRSRFVS